MGEKCPLELEKGTVTTELMMAMNLEISVVYYCHLEIAQLWAFSSYLIKLLYVEGDW